MKHIDQAFAKGISSAFIVASPFQLLCAIEAIHEFEIKEYQIIFILEKASPRNQQLFAMAESFGVKYDLYWHEDIYQEYKQAYGKNSLEQQACYDRIFIGDYSPVLYKYLALRYANQDAVLVYLDDGNSTICFLRNQEAANKPKNWRKWLNWEKNRIIRKRELAGILAQKSLKDPKCFFTIYSNVKPTIFAIYPNTFAYVSRKALKKHEKEDNIVLIVGTAIQAYAEEVCNIDISLMEAIHWDRLKRVRDMYPNQKIVYIPHGRDNNAFIPQFCSMLDIEYAKISEPIESYMLKSSYEPVAIYSFGSSALYTLHKFYSKAQVVSWKPKHIDGDGRQKWEKTIDAYYAQDGIKEDDIWLPKGVNKSSNSIGENLLSIINLIKDKLHRK